MRISTCLIALAFVTGSALTAAAGDAKKGAGPGKPDPDRVRGMKAALADLEAGKLRLKFPPLPAPAWHGPYLDLLKAECGVEAEQVTEFTGPAGNELHGYNDLMTLEIEHRFGKGILAKLQDRAAKPK